MGRHSSDRVLLAVASFLVLFVVPTRVFAGELIFAQSIDGRSVFVYSINPGSSNPSLPPPPTFTSLRSTSITLSAKLQHNGTVTVTGVVADDGSGAPVLSATVATSWTLPNGATQEQTATTATSGNANFSTKAGRGTYTLTVTNPAKSGYTFDATNSTLTKSIAK